MGWELNLSGLPTSRQDPLLLKPNFTYPVHTFFVSVIYVYRILGTSLSLINLSFFASGYIKQLSLLYSTQ